MVTVVFAAYAVGVVASLFLAGHVSDRLGRRRILLASILVEVLASAVFLLWPEVPGLIVARLLTGLGVGALTATATAHLSELRAIARPEEGPGTSRAVSTLVNMGGLALGPLVGGIFAVTVDRPLVVPYEVFLVLLIVLGLAVALVPETVERREILPAYRPQRLAVPEASRGTFLSAAVGAFAGFAVFGLFTSLAPTFLAGRFGEASHPRRARCPSGSSPREPSPSWPRSACRPGARSASPPSLSRSGSRSSRSAPSWSRSPPSSPAA
ncbi:MFS transporter [Rathayibacter oskolensis]|uniref:MFS transporter n=1 Tax=Rathayibacter oskolensis TaxID=1891671 RepID=UPI00265E9FC1|nr:MFS transporter [Rathayibacter oskolensis]WKK71041.1 MFS transporter [Rathayibacter oskolensis]